MIDLEEYKNYLINYYRHEIDNNDNKRLDRKKRLDRAFNDRKLENIINDTYDFIKDVLNSDTIKNGYCVFPMEDDTTEYIFLGLTGGFYSDTLFTDYKERTISKYIMRCVFGKKFYIEVTNEEIERELDFDEFGDILSFEYSYSLYMQGFPDNIDEIKKNIYGVSKTLRKN